MFFWVLTIACKRDRTQRAVASLSSIGGSILEASAAGRDLLNAPPQARAHLKSRPKASGGHPGPCAEESKFTPVCALRRRWLRLADASPTMPAKRPTAFLLVRPSGHLGPTMRSRVAVFRHSSPESIRFSADPRVWRAPTPYAPYAAYALHTPLPPPTFVSWRWRAGARVCPRYADLN